MTTSAPRTDGPANPRRRTHRVRWMAPLVGVLAALVQAGAAAAATPAADVLLVGADDGRAHLVVLGAESASDVEVTQAGVPLEVSSAAGRDVAAVAIVIDGDPSPAVAVVVRQLAVQFRSDPPGGGVVVWWGGEAFQPVDFLRVSAIGALDDGNTPPSDVAAVAAGLARRTDPVRLLVHVRDVGPAGVTTADGVVTISVDTSEVDPVTEARRVAAAIDGVTLHEVELVDRSALDVVLPTAGGPSRRTIVVDDGDDVVSTGRPPPAAPEATAPTTVTAAGGADGPDADAPDTSGPITTAARSGVDADADSPEPTTSGPSGGSAPVASGSVEVTAEVLAEVAGPDDGTAELARRGSGGSSDDSRRVWLAVGLVAVGGALALALEFWLLYRTPTYTPRRRR